MVFEFRNVVQQLTMKAYPVWIDPILFSTSAAQPDGHERTKRALEVKPSRKQGGQGLGARINGARAAAPQRCLLIRSDRAELFKGAVLAGPLGESAVTTTADYFRFQYCEMISLTCQSKKQARKILFHNLDFISMHKPTNHSRVLSIISPILIVNYSL